MTNGFLSHRLDRVDLAVAPAESAREPADDEFLQEAGRAVGCRGGLTGCDWAYAVAAVGEHDDSRVGVFARGQDLVDQPYAVGHRHECVSVAEDGQQRAP